MSYNPDPLYYHTKVNFDELLETREKAIRFKINGLKVWMPKKCCRQLDEINKKVYIWTKVYESNMLKTKEFVENLNKNSNSNNNSNNSKKQENLLH